MGHKGAPGAGGGGGGAGAGAGLSAEGAEIAEGAELPAEVADSSSLEKPKPSGAPVRVGWARKKKSTELNLTNSTQPTQPGQLNSPNSPDSGESQQTPVLAEVNQALGPGRQRIEALGSEAVHCAKVVSTTGADGGEVLHAHSYVYCMHRTFGSATTARE